MSEYEGRHDVYYCFQVEVRVLTRLFFSGWALCVSYHKSGDRLYTCENQSTNHINQYNVRKYIGVAISQSWDPVRPVCVQGQRANGRR